MKKLLLISFCSFFVCWLFVACMWIIVGLVNCFFINECINYFNLYKLIIIISLINIKDVFFRGTILAIILIIYIWSKLRNN